MRIVRTVSQVSIPWSWIIDVTVKKFANDGSTSYTLVLVTDRDLVPVPTPSSPEQDEMEALRAFLLQGRDLARRRVTDDGTSGSGDEPETPAPPPSGTPEHGTPEYGTPQAAAPPSSPHPGTPDLSAPQPSPSGSSRGPLLAGVAVALLMVGAVGLAFGLTDGDGSVARAAGSTPGATPAAPSTLVDLFDLRTGDCVLYQGSPEVLEDIGVVPCTQQHDAEMSGSVTLPEAPWPGVSTLQRRGDDACLPIFESYVGVPVEDSRFAFASITPDQETWESGDRTVICLVILAIGTVATPMAGSSA